MILSDRHKFVFVHIPKCAGTSVRNAVLPFHDADERFLKTVGYLPGLGTIDYRHLPLPLLRMIDPDAFRKLRSYESYALLRDPFQRFGSAMSQRAKMYLGKEFARFEERELCAEIDKVITYLQTEPAVFTAEYIHFARQSDFVEFEGKQMVRNLYPVERIDCLMADLANLLDTSALDIGHANRTTVFRFPILKSTMYRGSALAKRVLPLPFYEGLRRSARQIVMKPSNTSSSIFVTQRIRDFVEQYYARDITLHNSALEKTSTQAHGL